jgi:hypothetical protein
MKEQDLIVTTFVKLDKWDRLKVLFGRCLKIETKVIIPQEQPIEMYNAVSNTSIVSSTGNFIKQDRPPFGYVSKDF